MTKYNGIVAVCIAAGFCGIGIMRAESLQVAAPPPFFSASGTAFEAIPGVVYSGVAVGAKTAVSSDHKYVTIGAHANHQQLRSLQSFDLGALPKGYVGIGPPSANALPANALPANALPGRPAPRGGAGVAVVQAPTLLEKTGMTLIAAAQP